MVDVDGDIVVGRCFGEVFVTCFANMLLLLLHWVGVAFVVMLVGERAASSVMINLEAPFVMVCGVASCMGDC